MGVRGVWSLISSDPKRFSTVWNFSDEASGEKKNIIWIDGPSLLYFIALQPRFQNVLTNLGEEIDQIGQADPSEIHLRTTNFLWAVMDCCDETAEVHVVMDGLSTGADKIPTQLDRMAKAARIADENLSNPQRSVRNCPVISILAESSMIEAVQDMMVSSPDLNLKLHSPSRGEAECFINSACRQRQDDTKANHIVLSNDTDFLFYEHSPGFIPFKSLNFDPDQSKLSGVFYLRSRFCRAFSLFDALALSAVATLAGCDYSSGKIDDLRSQIVQSNIAGLRRKVRKNPTSAESLTAVIRYVQYYVRLEPEGWMEEMEGSLSRGSKVPALSKQIQSVHQVYYDQNNYDVDDGDANEKMMQSIECRRLFGLGAFFCRPLLESFLSPDQEQVTASNDSRRRVSKKTKKKKKGGKRRRQHESASVPNENDQNEETFNGPPGSSTFVCDDEIIASEKFNWEQTFQALRASSAYTLPCFVMMRRRIYAKLTNKSTLSEYRLMRPGPSFEFREYHVMRSNIDDENDKIPASTIVSLVPIEMACVLTLLLTRPPNFAPPSALLLSMDQKVMNFVSMSIFHLKLLCEVSHESLSELPRAKILSRERIMFLWDVACRMTSRPCRKTAAVAILDELHISLLEKEAWTQRIMSMDD